MDVTSYYMSHPYMQSIIGISKSLHDKGYRVEGLVSDKNLPENLAMFGVRLASGVYLALRIVVK